ncbi:MAG: zinc-binding dehydrogenase [Gammaproteobacteria bacterium]|nr:zinc-binding dehydrogenase [Gammaproteobacteria bacterium]MDH3449765.1 zinc-binding dehydrogenase [Gammaproteobacteria bacterium]
MPNKMKAAVLSAPGGPEKLDLTHVDLPWPASPGDVLVRLKTAALNPADAYFRSFGPYISSAGPCILGHDGAGVVEAVGDEVTGIGPGQRVCFCNGGIGGAYGTYAEFAVVPESQLALVPDAVDDASAAALPLVLITGWESLYDRARLEADEFVLVHAGAGGTGHVAVQLAALRGARVAATVSTEDKVGLVTKLGVERAIPYRSEDFVEAAQEWTTGHGIDVALDNLGPEVFRKTIPAMSPYGRLVTLMGTPGDDENETAYVNNLTIHNVMMLTPMILGLQDRLDSQAEIVRQGLQLLAERSLRIEIDSRFEFDDIVAAHQRLDLGKATGKIVIAIAD